MKEYDDKLRDEWAKEGMDEQMKKFDEQKKKLMSKRRNSWAIVGMW
jgi:hypothetical protein